MAAVSTLQRKKIERSNVTINSFESDSEEMMMTEVALKQEFPFESPLIGKYIKLKNVDNNDDIVMYQIQSITSPHKIKIGDEDDNDIPDLIQQSTNQWLLLNDYKCNNNSNTKTEQTNFFIAFIVVILQIISYMTMVWYLWSTNTSEISDREENCYGPYCKIEQIQCMDIKTGGVTAILLIGFLWPDFINTSVLIKDYINKEGFYLRGQLFGSIIILIELFAAIICGIYVGIYSDSDFDAINGAVGILFVHDLDEKIYAAMSIIEVNWKRILALILWIIISVIIAMSTGCIYQQRYWLGGSMGFCRENEFKCNNGQCIWFGFICNGVENCEHGEDEIYVKSLNITCNYSLINCPEDTFMCITNGECIDNEKRCDGILDCSDGSDESRLQNCSQHIAEIDCGINQFKCNNGQCIDIQFMCDGVIDCIDGTDEYPNFYSLNKWPFLKECPYHLMITCDIDEVLCKLNGHCISKVRICDEINDCPNGEDERFCFYHWNDFTEFKCGQKIAKIEENRIVLFENEEILYYNNYSDFWYIYDNILYPNDSWILLKGKVIPIEWRCDGIMDCDDGTDEYLCKYYECNENEYKCKDNGFCIPDNWKCDEYPDCGFSHSWYIADDDENNDQCNADNTSYIDIKCNQMINGSITHNSHAFNLYSIYIPCDVYKTVMITTCTENTLTFNTLITFKKDLVRITDVGRWENDDAEWECNTNYFASTIKLNEDKLKLICNQQYYIEVRGKYLKQSFGDYGLKVICNL